MRRDHSSRRKKGIYIVLLIFFISFVSTCAVAQDSSLPITLEADRCGFEAENRAEAEGNVVINEPI